MKIKYLITSCFLVTTLYSNEYSLNALIDLAIQNNTDISISRLNTAKKQAGIQAAKSDYLPSLTAVGEIAQYDIESNSENANDSVNSLTLSASQLLYDFGKTTSTIAASKEEYTATLEELISTTSNIVLSVKEAYYNILNQHKLIEVAKESVVIDDLQLNQAIEYFNAGIKTKIDVTNAKLQLSNSKLDLLKANFALKTAKAKFITILGKDLRESLHVKKEIKDIDYLTKNLQPEDTSLEQLIENALNDRAEISVQKALINSSRQTYKATKSEYFPNIKAKGSYKDSNSDDISSLDTTQYSAGVYLEWNFFSGFKTTANTKQNLADLRSEKQKLKQEELSIKKEVTIAYFDVKENIDALKISRLNVNLAQQKLQLAQDRYKNGLNDIVELNDAKLDFIKAKNELVNTYYTYKTAIASLDYATGIVYKK